MRKIAVTIATLLALGISANANAEVDHTGFYLGGSLGNFELDDQVNSESATGVGVYGGYNFNDWFGLETHLSVASGLDQGPVDISAANYTLTPKFSYNFNDRFSVFAKLGIASMAVVTETLGVESDFTGVGFTYGLGLNYAATDKLNIRLSYDKSNADLELESTGFEVDTDISQLALGVHYQF